MTCEYVYVYVCACTVVCVYEYHTICGQEQMYLCVCVRACMRVCVHACVRASVRVLREGGSVWFILCR